MAVRAYVAEATKSHKHTHSENTRNHILTAKGDDTDGPRYNKHYVKRGRKVVHDSTASFLAQTAGSTVSLKEAFAHPSERLLTPAERKMPQFQCAPGVSIARWVCDLMPIHELNPCLHAATLLGMEQEPTAILMPQFGIHDYSTSYMYHHHLTGSQYEGMWEWGDRLCIQDFRAILRTAIVAGLQLPGWKVGRIEPVDRDPFTVHEWVNLLVKAQVRPNRPDLIPQDVYRELEIDPLPVAEYYSLG